MTMQELLVHSLTSSAEVLQATLEDFSDAEFLIRPVPKANHIAWQLGHLAVSECQMMTEQGIRMPALPPGFVERYGHDNTTLDDPTQFNTKAELMEVFQKVRAASIAYAQQATEAQLNTPTINEMMRKFVPNTATLLDHFAAHLVMHLGQFQVLRRKLGKPIMF